MKKKFIKKENIKEEIALIKGSNTDYVSINGNIYKYYSNEDAFIKKRTYPNNNNGYIYCGVNYIDGYKQRRVHILVAETFIPNIYNKSIVMHKDNNKQNNNVDNLKWGTISENTKQAVDDGLLKNDSGFDDSQSIPVNMYDLFTTKLIKEYGSISEASKETGITTSGIICSCKNKYKKIRLPFYFRYATDGNIDIPDCIGMYDNNDNLIKMFINVEDASSKTNISDSTISYQINNNCMNWHKNDYYFKKIIRYT